VTTEAAASRPASSSALRNGAIGAASVAAALGAQELFAGLTGVFPSLVAGAAAWIIDTAPVGLAEWAIHTLEFWTKPTIVIGISTVLLTIGVATSGRSAAVRRGMFAPGGIAGTITTALGPDGLFASLVTAVVAVGAGLGADHWLRRPARSPAATTPAGPTSRRRFITSVASIGALAVTAALLGRQLVERSIRRLARRDDVVLPEPVSTVDPVTSANEFGIEGLDPVVTPNDRFFTIDINALNIPEIDLETWTLEIGGMVDRELSLTYEDLLEMDLVEQYATLSCVSNKVGGRLVGNARWLGVPFSQILEMAGARPTAEQVAAHGADGFSTGFPLAAVYDRETLLAIGMNGEPLPYKHGFPARLVIPGYYGFVSAAKWLRRIDLTTWDAHDAYWVKLGWAKNAPVETQSRIDAPRDKMTIPAQARMIAGVAWAPHLGIDRVEVRIDEGPWVDAELSEPLGAATWVQWRLPWTPTAGDHTIAVRATDGSGATQTPEERAPVPSGATGHHTIKVRAE
jgi:DMSO/TMAO reductase YedYZ molybdopterin-dependent catalytic subunit